MPFLFDFGISQEDPLSEQLVLDVHPDDRILSVASGGEVPLSLLALNEGVHIKAVDISADQVRLCRLKLLAALHLGFPQNGRFLGYGRLDESEREQLYQDAIRPHLSGEDAIFWDRHTRYIEKGIINAGRFEQYVRKMRLIGSLFIGKQNIHRLMECQTLEEQRQVFIDFIAPRKSLRLLFKIAFHPAVYRKRGLQEQALIHAGKNTGDRFYSKFQDFCINSLAAENYFLQYFLTGSCITDASFPEYLQPVYKNRLINNLNDFKLEAVSLQDALAEKEKGYYNKIHLSNLGDWLSEAHFGDLLTALKTHCPGGARICCRYLQKNHFAAGGTSEYSLDNALSLEAERKDRFPFYTIQSITLQGSNQTSVF